MNGLFDSSIRFGTGSAQGRPMRLLNIVLGLIAALIGGALVKSWVAPSATIPVPAAAKLPSESATLAFNPTARPSLAQFDVLLEKNPFKRPPPQPAQPPGPPPPPPIPAPTLVGTMLVDHERKAILNDRGKANIYSVGQEVAGGTVTEIREDRILYKRGDVISELTLKAPIQAGAAPTPAPVTSPTGPTSVPSVAPLPQPAQAVEGSPAPQRPPMTAAERRRLRILQQRGLLGRPQDQAP